MKKLIKSIVRIYILPIIYYLNLFDLLTKSKNNRLILMYHGIIENDNFKYNNRHFSKSTFEKHLKYYQKHFNVVSLSEIFEMKRKNIIPDKKTIAITFDDGFENNYNIAFPLLKKYNLPATFFVSAVCVDNNNEVLWPDFINILRQNINENLNINNLNFIPHFKHDFYNLENNISLLEYLKQQSARNRDKIINDLREKYFFDEIIKNVNSELWKLMNKEQLIELSKSELIEISSHGYLHYNLANIEKQEAFEDLSKSKEILEKVINKKISSIAFPDGSYNLDILEMCKDIGYNNLCAVTYKNKSDNQYNNLLQRYGISTTTSYYSNIFFIFKSFKNLGF